MSYEMFSPPLIYERFLYDLYYFLLMFDIIHQRSYYLLYFRERILLNNLISLVQFGYSI